MDRDFLIDGYNLLRARTGAHLKPGPGNLERARGALLGWLTQRLSAPARWVVVFDSAQKSNRRARKSEWESAAGAVLFANGYPDADAMIIELCEEHPTPRRLVVVSNDRAVQDAARRRGATPMGCADFQEVIDQPTPSARPKPIPQKPQEDDKPIPGTTDAEREFWAKAFGADDTDRNPPPPRDRDRRRR